VATQRARRNKTPQKAKNRGANPRASGTAGGPPSLNQDHLKGFAVGAIGGLLIGVASMAWLTTQGEPPAVTLSDPAATTDESSGPKPRYDFFTVLPNQHLDLASDVEPAGLSENAADGDVYLLQAGSFRLQKDADRRRAELALLGLTAAIEETRGDNGLWFRVYVGPFESRSAMARARSITAQQSIDTLLLKRPRNP
jgi:cell division protein FtsN